MNFPTPQTLRLLLLAIFFAATVRADEQRWLLVFDTSAAMKKRLPAMEASVKTLLESSIDGKISPGDGVAVWVFDESLRTRQFPITEWDPGQSATVASNLVAFLHSQKFSGSTKFDVLKTNLSVVIARSERLTILIFCDGADTIHWTPYDDGINNTFSQTAAERKKSLQPFVLLLRTQQGKFTGATVNYPPSALNVPAFPLLPREIKPVVTNPPPAPPPPPPQPVAAVAPLIIVGTRVSTNADDVPKETAPTTNALVIAVPKTNLPPPAAKVVPPTLAHSNPPAPVAAVTNVSTATNAAPITATENRPAQSSLLAVITIAGLLLLAVIVGLLFFGRQRSPRGSLITSSMQDEVRPPDRK